jgi:hypothetical protein
MVDRGSDGPSQYGCQDASLMGEAAGRRIGVGGDWWGQFLLGLIRQIGPIRPIFRGAARCQRRKRRTLQIRRQFALAAGELAADPFEAALEGQ